MIRLVLLLLPVLLGGWLAQGGSTPAATTQTVWLNDGAMFTTIGARTVWTNTGAVKQ
jgi:hypothetical protein